MSQINFFNEDHSYTIKQKKKIRLWLTNAIICEYYTVDSISIILTSDNHILEVNKKHLNHNYYTDIITFNYNEDNSISGDLYISIDRVKDNAKTQNVTLINELHRVIIHGVLHLLGYNDKTEKEIKIIREKEDFYLSIF